MTVQELISKAKLLELQSRKLSNSLQGGSFRSAFKGRGMSFKEVREYMPGDDPRFIDWNTTARLGDPFTKVFEEEKDLRFLICLDMSASTATGSAHSAKRDYMAEILATLGFSALMSNEKTGLLLFTDQVEKYLPPMAGKDHLMRLLAHYAACKPTGRKTDIAKALDFVLNTTRQTTVVFLLSDFEDADYLPAMKRLAIRHDCIAVHLYDSLDAKLPNAGVVPVQDAETGEYQWLDLSDHPTRAAYANQRQDFITRAQSNIGTTGWDYIRLHTGLDYLPPMQAFLRKRLGLK